MGYGIIADVGNLLVDILAKDMVPDVIQNADGIGLCSPDEHGDLTLGIYLYDINESEELVQPGMVNNGLRSQSFPSTYLNLYYMITAYSASDMKFRATEEQKILGKTVQVLRDHSVIAPDLLGDGVSMAARIELQKIDHYEKMRMWNFPNVPYKLSLFYRVMPVEIPSAKSKSITRVTNVEFAVQEQKNQ